MRIKTILCVLSFTLLVSGCGNDWEVTKKNWNSDFGDLTRHVKVYDSISKEVLWEYTGDVYLRDSGNSGNYSIIYRDSKGKVRKNDFIGNHIGIVMQEVTPNMNNMD